MRKKCRIPTSMKEYGRTERGNDVTQEYLDWCEPLAGDGLQKMLKLKKREKE